ncbi:MAG: c-type cytochrome, partial [Verrucomicrobiota bacterium]
PFLSSDDRWLRYAARIAIEAQDVALWKDAAIKESNPQGALTALLALARVGGKETQSDLLMALKRFPLDSLTEDQKLEKLRLIELSFIRQGKPAPEIASVAIEKLNAQYPAKTEAMNRELCQLLIYLEAPGVVEKTFTLMDKAPTQEEKIHYIFHLRNLKTGWTLEQRQKYFAWFNESHDNAVHPANLVQWFADVDRGYSDGASFSKQLAAMKREAIENLSESDKVALADVFNAMPTAIAKAPAKERKFVKDWKMADLEPELDGVGHGRNFASGKAAFTDAQCIACHHFGNEGGAVGPELTAASSKYARRDILDSIIEPSKVVSEQYQNYSVTKKDGDELVGRIVDDTDTKLVMLVNPFTADRTEVKKSEIASRKPARLSPMPEGLINNLTKEEVLDLLAYIESMGKPKAANFKK